MNTTAVPKAAGRNVALDYAKGMGIIIVVFAHLWRGLHGANLLKDIPESTFLAISSTCTMLSMPAFFFASGLLFGKNIEKKHGIKEFSGKFDAIFYPYLIWSLIIGVFEVLTSGLRNGSSTFSDLTRIVFYPRGIFWFLYSLILAFALTELLTWLAGPKRARWLSLLVSIVLLWAYPAINTSAFSLDVFALSYIYFSLGLMLSKSIPQYQFRARHAPLWLLAIIAAQYVFHMILGDRTFSFQSITPNATLFAVASGFLFFGLAYSLPERGMSWLANLGEKSMDIYLLHLLFIAALRIFFEKILGIQNIALYLVPGLVLGVYGPLLVADLLRRKGLNFLFSPPARLSLRAQFSRTA